jgi:hypothetical protein
MFFFLFYSSRPIDRHCVAINCALFAVEYVRVNVLSRCKAFLTICASLCRHEACLIFVHVFVDTSISNHLCISLSRRSISNHLCISLSTRSISNHLCISSSTQSISNHLCISLSTQSISNHLCISLSTQMISNHLYISLSLFL